VKSKASESLPHLLFAHSAPPLCCVVLCYHLKGTRLCRLTHCLLSTALVSIPVVFELIPDLYSLRYGKRSCDLEPVSVGQDRGYRCIWKSEV
jgi:hypothetical protein